jgi:NTP pyrophosphatase (non-canonical NTP hydrolase)
MKISHKLASKKDKKCTILASDVAKKLKTYDDVIKLHYLDYGYIVNYHKSRNGKTYYCDSVFPNNIPMPNIGEPVTLDVNLIQLIDLFGLQHESEKEMVLDMKLTNEFEPIRNWANKKGIFEKGNPTTQFAKLIEEAGELAKSLLKQDEEEFIDAIGDCVVVLTNLAKLKGYNIEDCINSAYSVIAKRTGKMENGTFVKDSI